MYSTSPHETQSLSYSAVPFMLYRSTEHTVNSWETFTLVLEKSSYTDHLLFCLIWELLCPLGAKQMELWTRSETPHQNSSKMLKPSNSAALFAAVCSLTHPSGNMKRLIFLLYVPLLHGLKYDRQSSGVGSIYYIPLFFPLLLLIAIHNWRR